jgi:hypothetical protein
MATYERVCEPALAPSTYLWHARLELQFVIRTGTQGNKPLGFLSEMRPLKSKIKDTYYYRRQRAIHLSTEYMEGSPRDTVLEGYCTRVLRDEHLSDDVIQLLIFILSKEMRVDGTTAI